MKIMRVQEILKISPKNPIKILYDKYGYLLPWDVESVTYEKFSFMYRNHSALKILHFPIADDYITDQIENISDYIFYMLNDKWLMDWRALNIEYNPLHNVDMKENNSRDSTKDLNSQTQDNTHSNAYTSDNKTTHDNKRFDHLENGYSKDNTDNIENVNSKNKTFENSLNTSKEKNDTNTESNTITQSLDDTNIYGFNSTVGANSEDVITNTQEKEKTNNGQITNSTDYSNGETLEDVNTNTVNQNKKISVSSKDFQDKENLTHSSDNKIINNEVKLNDVNRVDNQKENTVDTGERAGADGRFSPQDLLTQELEYRLNIFFDRVFDSLDSILTIPCY